MGGIQQNESPYKLLAICVLTIQQASMPLMVRYTRYRPPSEQFITTVNVFMMEIIKIVVCSGILLYAAGGSIKRFLNDVRMAVWEDKLETAKICVPALVYTLQNNLYYIALSHLEATTFCVGYQSKVFTTALAMRFVLGKRLSAMQWFALTLLMIGVVDVQLQYAPPTSRPDVVQRPLLGLIALVSMCLTSAFAGVYMEKALKASACSVAMQNIRLALIGVPISAIAVYLSDWDTVVNEGWWRGWDLLVWIMTTTNSVGGILIAFVIKHADNIAKAYAQSTAIVGAGFGSWLLFDFMPNGAFCAGVLLVCLSILFYNRYPYRSSVSNVVVHALATELKPLHVKTSLQ